MEPSSVIYYDECTKNLYFGEQLEKEQASLFDIGLLTFYLFGFYHLSWYIINKSRQYSYDDILVKLNDSRTILRIINNTLDIYDEKSLDIMNTTALLEQTLSQFNDDNDNYDSDNDDSDNSCESGSDEIEDETHGDSEKQAAEILLSMGKNWVFSN